MAEYIHVVRGLSRSYDRRVILNNVTLAFFFGAKIGVIGHNGSGKSTLLRILAGVDREFDGYARPADGIRVGWVPQEPRLDPERTVLGNIEEAVRPVRDLVTRFEQLNERLAENPTPEEMERLLAEIETVQSEIDARDAWELDRHLEQAMHALDLPPGDAAVTRLSGGEKRRVALCRALLEKPDLLLLDEPTNHLDASTVAWLEQHLRGMKSTVIFITHDRYFLDNVAEWILELDRGHAFPFSGNYSSYLDQKQKRLEIEERAEIARGRMLARELDWIRQSPRARLAKSKARIANYQALAAEQHEMPEDAIELHIPPGPRLGDRVVTFRGVSKGHGGRTLIRDLSFELPSGGIIGVIGPNGAGKTTLLRLITGEEKPDAGTITLGESVILCHTDQERLTLDPANTVFQEITGGQDQIPFGRRWVKGRAYVARFNFRGPDQEKKVGELSGGERNRVQLAKMLRRGGNLILLDEPTNDLDLQTLRVLEEALQNFPGSAVIVTHDRYFLNRVATHVIAFEGDGAVRFFEGDFTAYEALVDRERAEGARAAESTKGRYRKLGP